jgi:uncharacterized protein
METPLGTAIATDLASRRHCAGLILEAALASLSEMAGPVVPFVGPLFAHGFNTRTTIGPVHVPILIIHGDVDELCRSRTGKAVFAAANPPKEFWRVLGAHHNDLLYAGR